MSATDNITINDADYGTGRGTDAFPDHMLADVGASLELIGMPEPVENPVSLGPRPPSGAYWEPLGAEIMKIESPGCSWEPLRS